MYDAIGVSGHKRFFKPLRLPTLFSLRKSWRWVPVIFDLVAGLALAPSIMLALPPETREMGELCQNVMHKALTSKDSDECS